jgi:hypothetical protein
MLRQAFLTSAIVITGLLTVTACQEISVDPGPSS